MLKITQLNIFLTLVRKLCAISSFMMCRQLCLVHQLGVITQSSAEFNNAETLEVTFSKIYMTRSQRWNKNALITVTKYHICDHNQIVGWNALQSWNGMMNSVFFLKEVQPVVRTIRTRPTVSTRSPSPCTHHHHHHYCFLSSHSHHDTISPCWDFVCNDYGGNLSVTKSHCWLLWWWWW